MNLAFVIPPLNSVHPAKALAFLPNVSPGSEEFLYHLDQVTRYQDWRHQWIDLSSVDMVNPTGSDHGPVLVERWTRTVVSGWGVVKKAQQQGNSRVAGYVGENLALEMKSIWNPKSQGERENSQAFQLLEDCWQCQQQFKERRGCGVSAKEYEKHFREAAMKVNSFVAQTPSLNPNAVGPHGQTLLGSICQFLKTERLVGTRGFSHSVGLLVQRGGLLSRSSRVLRENRSQTGWDSILSAFQEELSVQSSCDFPRGLVKVLLQQQEGGTSASTRQEFSHFLTNTKDKRLSPEGLRKVMALFEMAHLDRVFDATPRISKRVRL